MENLPKLQEQSFLYEKYEDDVYEDLFIAMYGNSNNFKRNNYKGYNKPIKAFERLVTIYVERKEFDKALEIYDNAIRYYRNYDMQDYIIECETHRDLLSKGDYSYIIEEMIECYNIGDSEKELFKMRGKGMSFTKITATFYSIEGAIRLTGGTIKDKDSKILARMQDIYKTFKFEEFISKKTVIDPLINKTFLSDELYYLFFLRLDELDSRFIAINYNGSKNFIFKGTYQYLNDYFLDIVEEINVHGNSSVNRIEQLDFEKELVDYFLRKNNIVVNYNLSIIEMVKRNS